MVEVSEFVEAIKHPEKEVVRKALDLHEKFSTEVWGQDRESFHNKEHIEAAIEAANAIVENAKNGFDPLNIMGDLAKWNEQNPDANINVDELNEVMTIAFACHDLGNILNSLEENNGNLEPNFLNQYKASGAEERSKVMSELIIQNTNGLSEDKRDRFVHFVNHIIEQTKFKPGKVDDKFKEPPFAAAVMIIDQIGNDLYSTNEQRVRGLIEETAAEDPSRKINLDFFNNFVIDRLRQIYPDKSEEFYSDIYKSMGKEQPKRKTGLPKFGIKASVVTKYYDTPVVFDYIAKIKDNPTGIDSVIEKQFEEETGMSFDQLVKLNSD